MLKFVEVFTLLGQSLVALTDGVYCEICLSNIHWKMDCLYKPGGDLGWHLTTEDDMSLRSQLFQGLLKTVKDVRFFLEEALMKIQRAEIWMKNQSLDYEDLNNAFIEILLDLRYGVYYKFLVPPRRTWSFVTTRGLEQNKNTIKRLFVPKVKKLIDKLYHCHKNFLYSKYLDDWEQVWKTSNDNSIKNYRNGTCEHYDAAKPWRYTPDGSGPAYPSTSKFHHCKYCQRSQSKKCFH